MVDIQDILEEVEQTIKDYKFLVKRARNLEFMIYGESVTSTGKSYGVAQYGDEAAMPRGSGTNLHALDLEEEKLKRMKTRLELLNLKVEAVEEDVDTLPTEKHKTIMELIMQGFSYHGIAKGLGIPKTSFYRMKEEIIEHVGSSGSLGKLVKNLQQEKMSM